MGLSLFAGLVRCRGLVCWGEGKEKYIYIYFPSFDYFKNRVKYCIATCLSFMKQNTYCYVLSHERNIKLTCKYLSNDIYRADPYDNLIWRDYLCL